MLTLTFKINNEKDPHAITNDACEIILKTFLNTVQKVHNLCKTHICKFCLHKKFPTDKVCRKWHHKKIETCVKVNSMQARVSPHRKGRSHMVTTFVIQLSCEINLARLWSVQCTAERASCMNQNLDE